MSLHSSHARVAVTHDPTHPDSACRAAAIGRELRLPVLASGADLDGCDYRLVVSEHRLELQRAGRKVENPLYVDFAGGSTGYRRFSGTSRRQLIARAVGVRGDSIHVLDATAGLGRDAFLLACLGCTVIAVERSPVLGALLRDGLARAREAPDEVLHGIVSRITLLIEDARDVLHRARASQAPDVVYLDPMYPARTKSALAKKEMRICRSLVGDDLDAGDLLAVARQTARKRVVVKRHHALPLADDVSLQYRGRTVRYDVYLTERGA